MGSSLEPRSMFDVILKFEHKSETNEVMRNHRLREIEGVVELVMMKNLNERLRVVNGFHGEWSSEV